MALMSKGIAHACCFAGGDVYFKTKEVSSRCTSLDYDSHVTTHAQAKTKIFLIPEFFHV
jgi:hypothetical protein